MWAYVPLPTTSATRLAATATDADTVRTNVSSATTSNLDGFKPSTFMLAIVAGRLAPLSTLPDDQETETEQPDRKSGLSKPWKQTIERVGHGNGKLRPLPSTGSGIARGGSGAGGLVGLSPRIRVPTRSV